VIVTVVIPIFFPNGCYNCSRVDGLLPFVTDHDFVMEVGDEISPTVILGHEVQDGKLEF